VLDIQTGEDPKDRRISLGCKQLHDPWSDADTRYPAGSDIQVKVVRLAPFGVFVEVEEGVEALIHISQLSRRHVDKPEDVVHEGDVVTARVLEVNPEQRRMRLSLSELEPKPEPEPVQPKEERQEHRADQSKGERPERSEGRGRKGKRTKPTKDKTEYEDDEAMYNPFAEAFKGTDWEKE
jgi:small subunit ribosomal protein S1